MLLIHLDRNGWILFCTRFLRLFSYGFLAVGLLLYLTARGYTQAQIGVLFTGTLIGDLVITFYLTTTADSLGRKNILLIGSLLKIGAGITFAFVDSFTALMFAGIFGIISPTGGEIGPFLAIEQSALTESIMHISEIPLIFGWYNLCGFMAQALGALSSGFLITLLLNTYHCTKLQSYQSVLIGYAFFGLLKLLFYLFLTDEIEPLHEREMPLSRNQWFGRFGLHRKETQTIVTKLSLLFVIDSFAGGFVMQTIIVYWFHKTFHMNTEYLGTLMMAANVFAGVSALAATPLVAKIGAINTMVVTHFPSNILLLLVPLMPNQTLAIIMLLARFSISQMDVPARQAYVACVVQPDERSAAGGITNIVRTIGLSLSPLLVGYLLAHPENEYLFGLPFIIAGGLKCIYDILLYISFRTSTPVSETTKYHSQAIQQQTSSINNSQNETEPLNGKKGYTIGDKA